MAPGNATISVPVTRALRAAAILGLLALALATRAGADGDPYRALGLVRPQAIKPAPAFVLATPGGPTLRLAEHRGKVVLLNFWATWCPPCRDELPSMLALGREIEARHPGRFKMVAISVDDGWDVVRDFFGGIPPPGLTVTLDTEQLTTRAFYCVARGACPESYRFPESYIVDKTGRLVAYVVGPRNWADPSARRFIEQFVGD